MKMRIQKQTIIKWLLITLWTALGAGTLVLLVAANDNKDAQICKGVYIDIRGVSNNFFVDKFDIIKSITEIAGAHPKGQPISTFDLKEMESDLQKNIWIKNAQLFFDNNDILVVNVIEREPQARIFNTAGETFYIDSSISILPLSEKFSARLPVFTGFPSDKKIISKADSTMLRDILSISTALQKDTFCMAMIDQIDITPQRNYEMIPKMGNSIILFGDAKDISEKLKKIRLFYQEIITKAGWSNYNSVNVQYKNQVIAKRKGAEDITADSLRTIQIMQIIAANAEKRSTDSLMSIMQDNENNTTNFNLIQTSIQREDIGNDDVNENNVLKGLPPINSNNTLPVAANNKPAVVAGQLPQVTAKPASTPDKTNVPQKQKVTIVKQPPKSEQKAKPVAAKPVAKKTTDNKPKNDF